MTETASNQGVTGMRPRSRAARKLRDRTFAVLCTIAALASVAVLARLLWSIFAEGFDRLDWDFVTAAPSRSADEAGIWPAMIGTIAICGVCMLAAIPIGVATAILLEEYKPRRRWLVRAHSFIQLNITNLAGVPSIVYGILGLTAFVQMFNLAGTTRDPALEFGITWYDRFVTEGQEVVRVAVEGRAAPLTRPQELNTVLGQDDKTVSIKVSPRQAMLAELESLDTDLDEFDDTLEEALDGAGGLETLSAGQIDAAVDAAWSASSLTSDRTAVKPEIVSQLLVASKLEGREQRRAVRRSREAVESAEARARFSGVLLADAVPSRVNETKPWYIRLPFGRGVLAGGLTLMLVVLPVVIIASQEALRAVPKSLRQASLALGATPWQTVQKATLPSALPGILTGIILATSRAIGEAAPILVIAGIVYITFTPQHLMDDFTAMPLQVFNWASRPQAEFRQLAAAGSLLLLAVLLVFNGVAIFIRQRASRHKV